MNRREFIKKTGQIAAGSLITVCSGFPDRSLNAEQYPELKKHIIEKTELIRFDYHYPRFVGKNSRKGTHGQYKRGDALKLYTDQGAIGWGLTKRKVKKKLSFLKGKPVSDLIAPSKGIMPGVHNYCDLALHDLMGIILNKPVYKILGNTGSKETPIYRGMIYFDELDPEDNPAVIGQIIKNCQWDYDYGYRQLKVKIGRSGKWYPHDKGLKKDIEVVKMIHKKFPDVDILVDSNDMYSLQDTIDFLKGIGDVPLFWVEEPFRENYDKGKKLRKWMNENGFSKTYYADGEAKPDLELCLKMGKDDILNVYLADIRTYGFTFWRNLIPQLKEINVYGSPHAWGDMIKTYCSAHIAAGLGSIVTLEGVTTITEDIDFGDYKIVDGKLRVSDQPGFGMKLLK